MTQHQMSTKISIQEKTQRKFQTKVILYEAQTQFLIQKKTKLQHS